MAILGPFSNLEGVTPAMIEKTVAEENAKLQARNAKNAVHAPAPAVPAATEAQWQPGQAVGAFVLRDQNHAALAPSAGDTSPAALAPHAAHVHPAPMHRTATSPRAGMQAMQALLEKAGFHTQGDKYKEGQPFDGVAGTNTNQAIIQAKRILNGSYGQEFAETAEITPQFKKAFEEAMADPARFASARTLNQMDRAAIPLPSGVPAPITLSSVVNQDSIHQQLVASGVTSARDGSHFDGVQTIRPNLPPMPNSGVRMKS